MRSDWQISDDISSKGAGMTASVGRPQKRTPPIPPAGSRLTVIRYMFTVSQWDNAGGYQVWRCRCSCGEIVDTHRSRIQSGGTKSCGCLRREMARERIKKAQDAHVEAAKKRRLANAQ
jgi:hypothetical protein